MANYAREQILNDKLEIILGDKDKLLPSISSHEDMDYLLKKTIEIEFRACCNEFWWCLKNAQDLSKSVLFINTLLFNTIFKDRIINKSNEKNRTNILRVWIR